MSPLLPVKGKVTYKGQPVAKGTIRFEPDGYGRPATGRLQSDGSFVLGTNKEGDGVVAGAHRVSVSGFDKPLASNRAEKIWIEELRSHSRSRRRSHRVQF